MPNFESRCNQLRLEHPRRPPPKLTATSRIKKPSRRLLEVRVILAPPIADRTCPAASSVVGKFRYNIRLRVKRFKTAKVPTP